MKHAADRLARQLEQSGIKTATLHSNRSQSQRLRALKDFKSGAVSVLVATDIAARGIDVDGISHVVNYDFPMHVEDYVHRIGRTGRANAVGDAISFVTPEDHGELRALERFIGRGIVRKRAEGFNYAQIVPHVAEDRPRHQQQARGQQRGAQRGQSSGQQRPQHSSSQPRPPQGGRPQHGGGGRPQHGGGNRPQQPASGNREGGNERHFPSRSSSHVRRFSPR
jgi:ATP-dependent RNA helicase RhlE